MPLQFLDPGPLIDRELELVSPAEKWIDEILLTCEQPAGIGDPTAHTTRQHLLDILTAGPGGRFQADPMHNRVPAYQFWMKLRDDFLPPIKMAGSISLRIGDTPDLRMYLGHIGYNVLPAARGRHYAERACRLLLPLARHHGLRELWITCNPDNIPSRRTCERLRASYIDTVALPKGHILHDRGERHKCRYFLKL